MSVETPKPWPLNGYAPGGYTCVCLKCSLPFEGDKRAIHCLDCAIATLTATNAELRAEVEKLTRERDHHSDLREQYLAEAERAAVKVKAELAAALASVEYRPGDYPVVPVKHADFVTEVRRIHSALSPAESEPEGGSIPLGRNNTIDFGGLSLDEPLNDVSITIRRKTESEPQTPPSSDYIGFGFDPRSNEEYPVYKSPSVESEPEQGAVKPIGYTRQVDVDPADRPFVGRTSFWVSERRTPYYSIPVFSRPPSERAVTEAEHLREAASRIVPYLKWTVGEESPGHHPTMPSAVGAFMTAFGWGTEAKWQEYRLAALKAMGAAR